MCVGIVDHQKERSIGFADEPVGKVRELLHRAIVEVAPLYFQHDPVYEIEDARATQDLNRVLYQFVPIVSYMVTPFHKLRSRGQHIPSQVKLV